MLGQWVLAAIPANCAAFEAETGVGGFDDRGGDACQYEYRYFIATDTDGIAVSIPADAPVVSFARVMGPPVCQWLGTTCLAQRA